MLDILAITGPIYLLIGLGFLAVFCGFLSKDDIRTLGRFVINFAVPALLFWVMAKVTAADIASADLLLAYALGSFAVLGLTLAITWFFQGKSLQVSALFGAATSISNSGVIGYPLILQALGPPGLVIIALAIVVENVVLAVALTLAESDDRGGKSIFSTLMGSFGRLFRTPFIIGLIAGALSAATGLVPPRPVARAIEMLALATGPVALFTIGGTLVGIKVHGMLRDVGQIVFTKLLIHPAAVFAALLLFPRIDPMLRAAAVTAASVPTFGLFPIIGQKFGLEKTGAATVLVATVFSFFTINAMLAIIHASPWFGPIH